MTLNQTLVPETLTLHDVEALRLKSKYLKQFTRVDHILVRNSWSRFLYQQISDYGLKFWYIIFFTLH